MLILHVTSSTSVSQIDTENAVEIKYVAITDETGLMVIEKDWITLTWSNESTVFVLGGTLSEEEIITIAENVKKK